MAWQNTFFMSRWPKHKTQYVKFQTSVSMYLDFNGNIAKWRSVQLGILHIILGYGLQRYDLAKLILHEPIANLEFRTCFLGYELDCYDFAKVMLHEPFAEIYSAIWHHSTIYTLVFCILRGRLLIRSSYLSASSHLYLSIWSNLEYCICSYAMSSNIMTLDRQANLELCWSTGALTYRKGPNYWNGPTYYRNRSSIWVEDT